MIVVPPGKFFDRSRYVNEIDIDTNKEYVAEASYKIQKKVHDNHCNYAMNWKQDDCKLGTLSKELLDKFNCTVPWLLYFTR